MASKKTTSAANISSFEKSFQIENYFKKEQIGFTLNINEDKVTATKIDGNLDYSEFFNKILIENSWLKSIYTIQNTKIPYPFHKPYRR